MQAAIAAPPHPVRQADMGNYRRATEGLRRAREVAQRRRHELTRLPAIARRIHRRRFARITAGATAAVLTLLAFGSLLVAGAGGQAPQPTALLIVVWPAAGLAWLLGAAMATPTLRAQLVRWTRIDGEPELALARLEAQSSAERAAEITHDLETSSIALPLVALSLAAPLSLHLLAYPLFASFSGSPTLGGFTTWMVLSAVIVGHAHLFLAGACVWFARRLKTRDPSTMTKAGWAIYGLTVLVSAIPGVVLVGLPPMLTALTGLVFAPAMFSWARGAATAERCELGAV